MPWSIEHKCSMGDAEPTEFAMLAGKLIETQQEVTRILCPECTEEFIVLGQEFFHEGHNSTTAGLNLPPGFVIASTRRA